MSTDSSYNELANDIDYYRTLLQLIHIHPMSNGGINWRIGDVGGLRQVTLENTTNTKLLGAKEGAIVTIAFCEGLNTTAEKRIVDQERIMQAGIITTEDIIKSTRDLIGNVKGEHLTSNPFLKNSVENAAKICLAKNSYNILGKYFVEDPERLNDPEAIILLAYVIIILGYRFELRPYMINPNLINVDWVTILDSMFGCFDNQNKALYVDHGYQSVWEAIKQSRDEIFIKKEAKKEAVSVMDRASNGIDIKLLLEGIFNRSPPSA